MDQERHPGTYRGFLFLKKKKTTNFQIRTFLFKMGPLYFEVRFRE